MAETAEEQVVVIKEEDVNGLLKTLESNGKNKAEQVVEGFIALIELQTGLDIRADMPETKFKKQGIQTAMVEKLEWALKDKRLKFVVTKKGLKALKRGEISKKVPDLDLEPNNGSGYTLGDFEILQKLRAVMSE